jgi:hypothetical protein
MTLFQDDEHDRHENYYKLNILIFESYLTYWDGRSFACFIYCGLFFGGVYYCGVIILMSKDD